MRHLPRTTRVLTMQVNPDTTPVSKCVLVVGRIVRPACENCDGFKAVKVVIGGRLVTIHCSECVPAPTAGLDDVLDDVEREDNGRGYEAEDHLLVTKAAA
ncbi:hypothetical protein [Streptomyces sp. PsTaAH-124]|uniref:hypothetical protein n=1 Tax=Streptomyces sp. PsTaAH-124 TaxID=1157638 RepID=UPI0005642CE5|nr:hypothetical protein [Streptomyces sp. PsTaAH-124]